MLEQIVPIQKTNDWILSYKFKSVDLMKDNDTQLCWKTMDSNKHTIKMKWRFNRKENNEYQNNENVLTSWVVQINKQHGALRILHTWRIFVTSFWTNSVSLCILFFFSFVWTPPGRIVLLLYEYSLFQCEFMTNSFITDLKLNYGI